MLSRANLKIYSKGCKSQQISFFKKKNRKDFILGMDLFTFHNYTISQTNFKMYITCNGSKPKKKGKSH